MKIVQDYIGLRNKHASYFKDYSADQRIKFKSEIQELKKNCDQIEISIVRGILNYALDFDRCFEELSSQGYGEFLTDNVAISKFRIKQSISKSIGVDEIERYKQIEGFKSLCREVWEDYIITKDERDQLNKYCSNYNIDKTQQYKIETSIREELNEESFDIENIISYYFHEESYSSEEIQNVLRVEYDKEVPLERIAYLIGKLNENVDKQLNLDKGASKIVRTIKINENVSAQLVVVNGNLTTYNEFDIGMPENSISGGIHFKIIITENKYNEVSEGRLMDIITDAICYETYSTLEEFLQHKPLIRQEIEKYNS